MRRLALLLAFLAAGCAGGLPAERAPAESRAPTASIDECRAEIDRLNARLAAEIAERQRLLRAAGKREETLKRQLEAMKSIERGILEREERIRSETR